MEAKILDLRRRFASHGPKARYWAAALVLEGSLVAMSFLVQGHGGMKALPLSQGLQIETSPSESVEALEDEAPEEEALKPSENPSEESADLQLTRFHILENDPPPAQNPLSALDPLPVEAQTLDETWLRPIVAKRQATPAAKAPSQAQVRLEPLEGQSPKPRYPAKAVSLGLEGSLLFRMHIDAEGRVVKLEVVEEDCPLILKRSAEKALRQWRFQNGPGVFEKRIVFRLVDLADRK